MKLKTWSYSKWKDYATCPRRIKFKADGVPEPKSPAMDRGTDIHKSLENYVTGDAARLPPAVAKSLGELKRDVTALRRDLKAEAEVEVAVDRRWRRVEWLDPAAWLRAKFDVRVPIVSTDDDDDTRIGTRIIDHKTGQERPGEHGEQLELYAVMEFSINDNASYVLGEIFYVDHGRKMSALYEDRGLMLGKIRDRWIARADQMLSDRRFEPNPGRACRWCPFSRLKGGPCDAG